MKLVLGGGAVLATALLTASFVFYVPDSALSQAALQQEIKQEQKQEQKVQDNKNENKQTEKSQSEKNDKENNHSEDKGDNKSTESKTTGLTRAENYTATAYALRGRTASGRNVARGIIAADPRVLPLGSRVRIDAGNWSGEYVVADTGAKIKGKKVDVWVPSNGEAMRFGRRTVKLTVLSYGTKRTTANKTKTTLKNTTKKK
jgi:3D (Asp-Asp-Asp) domain-containing protein